MYEDGKYDYLAKAIFEAEVKRFEERLFESTCKSMCSYCALGLPVTTQVIGTYFSYCHGPNFCRASTVRVAEDKKKKTEAVRNYIERGSPYD